GLFMQRKPATAHHKVDILGGVLLAIGTVAIVYWSNHVLEAPVLDQWTIALFMQMITPLAPGPLGLLFLPMSVAVAVTSVAAGWLMAATGRYKWLPVIGMALGAMLMLGY